VPALPATTSRTSVGHVYTPSARGAPALRPLLVRPEARFDCFGDGLCCTDIHALGPVTRAEKKHLDLIAPQSLVRHKDLAAPVFRTQSNGACIHRSERGCEVHATHGMKAKPTGCSRFPFGLMATPEGGRITTEHRCPCRTLGERPALTVEMAQPWLVDAAGRLSPNGRVGSRVLIAPGRRVSFERYRELEHGMIARLVAGEDALAVLEKRPLGRLEGERWSNVVRRCSEERDGTQYGEALVWFGAALRLTKGLRHGSGELSALERPWAWSFDRAEQRSPRGRSAEDVLGDWLADLVWSLDWVFAVRSFEAGRRELATLYAIALEIVNHLVRKKVRPDRAAAEAVMIVELTRQSDIWEDVQVAL
jgi:hypothetical protein